MIELLITYKYLIVIPISILEGPIISVICGFLATLGVFNPLLIFIIMIAGDIIGDAIFYYIGYKGNKLFKYFHIDEEKVEKAKIYFQNHHKKAIAGSKILWGIGTAGLIAAGALHTPYKKYFKTCAMYSIAQSFIMIMLGIFFGQSYLIIGRYFDYYAATASILVIIVIIFIIFWHKYKKSQERSL